MASCISNPNEAELGRTLENIPGPLPSAAGLAGLAPICESGKVPGKRRTAYWECFMLLPQTQTR